LKKKIDNVEYEIIPIPPHLSPYNSRISELLQKKAASFQDAEEISKEINQHMEKLLSETVTPKPRKEHQTEIYNAIIDLTNAVLEKAQFFRKNQRPSPSKSNATQPHPAQTSK